MKRGYVLTKTPFMSKNDLFVASGHWSHYKDGMFVLGDEEKDTEVMALRPMTCPFQFTVYNAEDGKVISKVKSDPYSTHAFDWFFPNGICEETMRQLSWIEEIPYEKAKMRSVDQVVRQNVSQYDDQNKKIHETQCQKKWQFVRIEE